MSFLDYFKMKIKDSTEKRDLHGRVYQNLSEKCKDSRGYVAQSTDEMNEELRLWWFFEAQRLAYESAELAYKLDSTKDSVSVSLPNDSGTQAPPKKSVKEDKFGRYKKYVKKLRMRKAGLVLLSAAIIGFEEEEKLKRDKDG